MTNLSCYRVTDVKLPQSAIADSSLPEGASIVAYALREIPGFPKIFYQTNKTGGINGVKKIFFYVVYFLVIWYVASYMYISYTTGLLSCFEDLYGKWSIYLIFALEAIAFLSPIYLRFILKKRTLIHLVAILICVCFFISLEFSYYITISYFKSFSVSNWEKYPNQRVEMIDDLIEDYNIIGMDVEEVITLLGEPDSSTGEKFIYLYDYGQIDVIISNNVVRSIEKTNYW